jgi:hypothetical protein
MIPQSGREARGIRVLRRSVNCVERSAAVDAEAGSVPYQFITRTDGSRISVALKLEKRIDGSAVREADLRFRATSGQRARAGGSPSACRCRKSFVFPGLYDPQVAEHSAGTGRASHAT